MNSTFLSRVVCGLVLALPVAAVGQPQPMDAQEVSFEVTDVRAGRLELRGKLWRAASPATAAVVLIHGSGGYSVHREGHYAQAFVAAGFDVLAVDSFGPRGISTTAEDQSQVSTMQMTRDAFGASRFLHGRGIPIERQAIMGFSKGGAVALFAADRTFLPGETARFAASLAFYPACSTRARVPKPASVVFMALGEKDDYSGVEPCQELAAAFRAAGGTMSVTVYPNATHLFDGDPARGRIQYLRFVENYMDCRLFVEEDGSMTLGDRRFAATDPGVLNAMRATCVRKGASIWTNLRQKERATLDAVAFVTRVLANAPR